MPKAKRNIPTKLIPAFVLADLTTSTPEEALKQQLKELGFRVFNNDVRYRARKQLGRRTALVIEARTLSELVAVAQCVWAGLNE